MLKLKDVPQEQMGEVVRIASEMYDREHTQKQERASTVAAAEELGIPEEYLERAAQELQEKRIAEARIKQERRRRWWIGGGVVAAIAAVGALVVRPVPVSPPLSLSPSVVQAAPKYNAGSVVSTRVESNAFVMQVDHFAVPPNGKYYADLNVPVNTSLSSYNTMTFTVRGTGIPHVKVFFQNGKERWRTQETFNVTEQGNQVTISLNNLMRQTSSGDGFKDAGRSHPGQTDSISFKVGEPINGPDVSGEIAISDIQLK